MNKGVIAAIAVAALMLVVVLMRPSSRESSSDDTERNGATGGRDTLTTRDGRRTTDTGLGSDDADDRGAGSTHRGSGSSNGPGSATDPHREGAAVLRQRMAAAGARVVRGGVPNGSGDTGFVEGQGVDETTGEAVEQQAAMRPKVGQNQQGQQNPSDTTTEVGGEPVPEVAYNGGIDKNFGTESQTTLKDVGKISGDAGTVSFWVKPGWGPGNQDDASFVQLGDSSLRFAKNVNFLRFEYFDKSGAEQGVGVNIGDWNQDWHQVTGTWNGRTYQLYVDGKPVSQSTFPQAPDFQNETQVLVGTAPGPGVPVAPADMTGLQILNRTASAAEILQQHQTGQHPK